MVHGSRVGQRLGFFVVWDSLDQTAVRDNISRKLRCMTPSWNTHALCDVWSGLVEKTGACKDSRYRTAAGFCG